MVQDLKRSETGLYHVPLAFQCIYRWSDERGKNGDREVGREGRLPGLLYADELVLCGESRGRPKGNGGMFVEVYRRRGLKVNASR